MREYLRWSGVAAAAVVLTAGLAVTAGSGQRAVFVHGPGDEADNVFFHEAGEGYDLSGLLDGETRTFGTGERAVTATRSGDVVTIDRADRDGGRTEITCNVGTDTCKVLERADGERVMLWIMKQRTCDGGDCDMVLVEGLGGSPDGLHEDHAKIVVEHQAVECEGDECPQVDVLLRRLGVDGAVAGPGGVFVTEGGAHVLRLESGQRTLRCPEGDVTMRVKAEEIDDVFLCPKHSVPLEKLEVRSLSFGRSTDLHEH